MLLVLFCLWLKVAAHCCLLQVRSLREELLAARRERAMTEAREAELRREIASLKRQVRPPSQSQADLTGVLVIMAGCHCVDVQQLCRFIGA